MELQVSFIVKTSQLLESNDTVLAVKLLNAGIVLLVSCRYLRFWLFNAANRSVQRFQSKHVWSSQEI